MSMEIIFFIGIVKNSTDKRKHNFNIVYLHTYLTIGKTKCNYCVWPHLIMWSSVYMLVLFLFCFVIRYVELLF